MSTRADFDPTRLNGTLSGITLAAREALVAPVPKRDWLELALRLLAGTAEMTLLKTPQQGAPEGHPVFDAYRAACALCADVICGNPLDAALAELEAELTRVRTAPPPRIPRTAELVDLELIGSIVCASAPKIADTRHLRLALPSDSPNEDLPALELLYSTRQGGLEQDLELVRIEAATLLCVLGGEPDAGRIAASIIQRSRQLNRSCLEILSGCFHDLSRELGPEGQPEAPPSVVSDELGWRYDKKTDSLEAMLAIQSSKRPVRCVLWLLEGLMRNSFYDIRQILDGEFPRKNVKGLTRTRQLPELLKTPDVFITIRVVEGGQHLDDEAFCSCQQRVDVMGEWLRSWKDHEIRCQFKLVRD
ncbi:MAG: hypothetical protein QM784_22760 [Polyangiaceae bacterium]